MRAGIQGFRQFGAHFLTHLRASLIGWITGAMSGANIYVPQAFTLREIIKFVLSVLGLTWQNIRQKLVRATSETVVRALETGFDLVVTLVTQGPAAAWERIQESLSNLREMVMEQVMTFVRDRIVQRAITTLVTSLNPAGAFVQAVIATYNTIMFFVERLRQIAQVAMSFIDSISAIAAGSLGPAANRVEQTMAGLLTLVISFLARIAGVGNISEQVTSVVNRVRAPIDRALDRVVDWIVAQARRLGRFVAQAGLPQDPNERLRLGMDAAVAAVNRFAGSRVGAAVLTPLLAAVRIRYGFRTLAAVAVGGQWVAEGEINPRARRNLGVAVAAGPGGPVRAPTPVEVELCYTNYLKLSTQREVQSRTQFESSMARQFYDFATNTWRNTQQVFNRAFADVPTLTPADFCSRVFGGQSYDMSAKSFTPVPGWVTTPNWPLEWVRRRFNVPALPNLIVPVGDAGALIQAVTQNLSRLSFLSGNQAGVQQLLVYLKGTGPGEIAPRLQNLISANRLLGLNLTRLGQTRPTAGDTDLLEALRGTSGAERTAIKAFTGTDLSRLQGLVQPSGATVSAADVAVGVRLVGRITNPTALVGSHMPRWIRAYNGGVQPGRIPVVVWNTGPTGLQYHYEKHPCGQNLNPDPAEPFRWAEYLGYTTRLTKGWLLGAMGGAPLLPADELALFGRSPAANGAAIGSARALYFFGTFLPRYASVLAALVAQFMGRYETRSQNDLRSAGAAFLGFGLGKTQIYAEKGSVFIVASESGTSGTFQIASAYMPTGGPAAKMASNAGVKAYDLR
ncbi:MAG: hypothetical protein JO040_00015 [Gemmatimonadetes bacterium]|nr:hypothetical protein [Gemmatimonadota bacterium]